MRAFLEKNDGEWYDDFVYISIFPLKNLGVEVIPFDSNNLGTLTKHYPNINTDIIIGTVESSQVFFKECGVDTPNYIGYPESLKKYLYRDIKVVKYSELTNEYPYFVKPKDGVKLFTGSLVDNNAQRKILKDFCNCEDDTELYLSEPLNFITEYRCFVHKGELRGIQYYRGDIHYQPDIKVIEKMISDYSDCNISYTLDVGVVIFDDLGEDFPITALVEVNDMWAIGSYGFDAKTYVRMVIDRFIEIKKDSKNEK